MSNTKQHPSSLRYKELCPRFLNRVNKDQSAAERGHRIHKAIETGDFSLLAEEELDCAAQCLEYKASHLVLPEGWTEYYELPMSTPLMLGTADYVQISQDRTKARLADWKTGKMMVDHAKDNIQAQSYAWMLMTVAGVHEVEVHLVAPLTEEPSSVHLYTREDIPGIHARVARIVGRVEDEADPTPNEKVCMWCGNKASCPALKQLALTQAATLPLPDPVVLGQSEIMTPVDRANIHIIASILEDWAKQVKAANTAAVVEDGVEIPGFALRQRAGNKTVTDVYQAVKRLKENGVPLQSVLVAASLSLPKLTDAFTAEKGGNQKDNRKVIETLLQDIMAQGDTIVYLQRAAKGKGTK